MYRIPPGLRRAALAAVLCCASLAAAAAPRLPQAVRQYVDGWTQHDAAKVDAAVSDEGGYRDPSLWSPIHGADLSDHVAKFKGAKFALQSTATPGPDKLDLTWTITWPDARGTQRYVDHLFLRKGQITMVDSEGGPIPESYWPPIRDYFKYREAAEGDKVYALFTEDGVIEARIFPPGGIKGERVRRHFDRDKEQQFIMRPDGRRQMTKDGRPTVDFQINRKDGSHYIDGREVFTLEGNRIARLQGLF
ncbi:hypothetical protein [Niveibacterium sp. SC-1]|uniref:hypothetical protein n=1 Tax=Niveibacterium sp. SC-1 TaxID=3135646 RepID=UPI00311FCF68